MAASLTGDRGWQLRQRLGDRLGAILALAVIARAGVATGTFSEVRNHS